MGKKTNGHYVKRLVSAQLQEKNIGPVLVKSVKFGHQVGLLFNF